MCLRDAQGLIVWVVAGSLGICDSTKVEVMGLLMGLRELKNLGAAHVSVEGESKVVVGWGLGKSDGSWKYVNLIHEIRGLAGSLDLSLSLIFQGSQNAFSDLSVNFGVGLASVVSANVMPDLPE